MTEFLLPHEVMDNVGVPPSQRADVAYKVLCAKYCALVEAVMHLTDGEPVRVSLRRAQELTRQNPRVTDPRELVMVAEDPAGDGDVLVRLANVDEIRKANHRYALWRMGDSCN